MEGNGEVVTCLKDPSPLKQGVRAGLMMRDRLEPVARSLFVGLAPDKGLGDGEEIPS